MCIEQLNKDTEKNMRGGLLFSCYCHIRDAFVLGGGTYVRVGGFCLGGLLSMGFCPRPICINGICIFNLEIPIYIYYMNVSTVSWRLNEKYSEIIEINLYKSVYYHTVRQKLSTTWLVSIISFLIMTLYFKSVCCFRYLYTHTYLFVKQVIDRFLFMCIWQGV